MEHNRTGIRDSDSNVHAYAKKLASILLEFLKYHYNLDFITDVEDNEPVVSGYQLFQNYPNPFNPATVIGYQISDNSHVTLKVFDFLGQEVATLVNQYQTTGKYEVIFNRQRTTRSAEAGARRAKSGQLTSGLYFYQLITNGFQQTKKMLLIK